MMSQLGPGVMDRFVDVIVRCLRATVGIEAVLAAVHEPPDEATIRVALEVNGDIRGPLTWVFPPEVALALVRRLLADPDPPADCAPEGATELANILTGHATQVLEASGFQCDIGVPQIHLGELPAGVAVRMETEMGPIDLVVSLTRAGGPPQHV